jgi:hypothetical protein
LSATIELTSPRTSSETARASSAGSVEVPAGSDPAPSTVPPTSPDVELADADPEALTLTESAGPLEPAVAPDVGVPIDPPWPIDVASPRSASATDTAHWQLPVMGATAPEEPATCETKDQIEFCIDWLSGVCGTGKLGGDVLEDVLGVVPGAVAAGVGSDVEPLGNGLVDVTATSVGEALLVSVPVEVGPEVGSVVESDELAGNVVGAAAAAEVSVAEIVEAALSLDGDPSARATVAAQHIQHAASAIARTATTRRRTRRHPRMTNKLQSPETDACHTASSTETHLHRQREGV